MNTGIQDAANLAWKLALVLHGQAADALLDSYERERRAVAEQVVAITHRMTQLATMRSRVQRMARNVLISAARRVGPLPRKLAGNLAQLDLTYRDGWRVDPSTKVARRFRPGAAKHLIRHWPSGCSSPRRSLPRPMPRLRTIRQPPSGSTPGTTSTRRSSSARTATSPAQAPPLTSPASSTAWTGRSIRQPRGRYLLFDRF